MGYLLAVLATAVLFPLAQASVSQSPVSGENDLLLADADADAMTAYEKALVKIVEVKASGAVILNLSGLGLSVIPDEISTLENLQGLNLFDVQVTDLRPLARLTQIKELNLFYVPVSDIRPLAKLTNLEHLDLNGTRVSDVRPLAKLSRLRYLDLGDALVSDYSPLDPLVQNGLIIMY